LKVLVTGGAGFIGTALVKLLAAKGHEIVILDNLAPQVHSEANFSPEIQNVADCIKGSVLDPIMLTNSLEGVDIVVHLAAETGTGQSMYRIRHYTEVNATGTSAILDVLVNKPHHVKKVVLASSRAVYGEGQYFCKTCGTVYPPNRSLDQLAKHQWEMDCPNCKQPVEPMPTQENAFLQPQSIYASNKQTQEQLVAIICQAVGIEPVILRYQNVFGPGQALTNPYTGVICAFFTRIIQGKPVSLFEDGQISRDFIFVEDVAQATLKAVESSDLTDNIFNIGTGKRTTIREVAQTLYDIIKLEPDIRVTNNYRLGDIRHCYADITRLEKQLNYTPQYSFSEGIKQFAEWALTQGELMKQGGDQLDKANAELLARNLLR
jgi:dTDP-L-rhamnose 4-epimerase